MNTWELQNVMLRDPAVLRQFGDVCAADELPSNISKRPSVYIVNSDRKGRPGRHWMAFYFPKKGPSEFFDPLGRAPTYYNRTFKKVLLRNGPRYVYNRFRVQPYNTDTCGPFCLYFVTRRCRGWSMTRIVRECKLNRDKTLKIV